MELKLTDHDDTRTRVSTEHTQKKEVVMLRGMQRSRILA